MSYSQNPQLPQSDCVPFPHMNRYVHGTIEFAAFAAIRSRTTNRMPYTDIMESPSTVYMLLDVLVLLI